MSEGDTPVPGRTRAFDTYVREVVQPKPKRILLIDDDKLTCELMRLHSEDFNVEWVTVYNAEAGLLAMRAEHYGLVLLDLRMDGMGGSALLKAVEDDEEQNIAVFTCHQESPEAREATRHGALVFVIKPETLTRKWVHRLLRMFTEQISRRPAGQPKKET